MKINTKISGSIFLIALIVAITAVPLAFRKINKSLRKTIFAHLETTANSKGKHIEFYILEHKAAVQLMANSVVIEDMLVSRSERQVSSELIRKSRLELKQYMMDQHMAYEIFVIDAVGIITISSIQENEGLDKSSDDYFINGKKKNHIKDAYYSESAKRDTFAISSPIFDDGNEGELLGVFVARIDMSELNEITTERTGLGKTGEAYLINKDDFFITSSRFIDDPFLEHKVETENASNKTNMVVVAPDYRGVDVIGARYFIEEMDWRLLVEIDKSEAYAPLRSIKHFFIGICIFVPLIFLLFGFISVSLILKPIKKLQEGMEIVGKGNLDHRVAIESKDEIGVLSRKFDGMTENLKKSTISISKLDQEIKKGKKSEEDLMKSISEVQFLDLLLYNSSQPFAVGSADGRLTKINPAFSELTGYTEKELISNVSWNETLTPLEWRELEAGLFAEMMKTGKSSRFEKEYIRKDGSRIPVELLAHRVLDDKANLKYIYAFVTDISSRKKAEEILKKSNKELIKLDRLKSDFLSVASHELRTPLTVIRDSVSQVLEGILGEITDGQKEFLTICIEDVDRLKRIIDNLLDISRISAGKYELQKEMMDIGELSRRTMLSFESLAKERNIELKENIPAESLKVYGDKDKIVQVFTNLIGNAFKFTKKGSIEIAIERNNSSIEWCVSDTGIGIAEQHLTKVFDRFQKFNGQTGDNKAEKSTGLGLYITKSIVELHNGRISVESTQGKGTKFTFSIPKYSYEGVLLDNIQNVISQAEEESKIFRLYLVSIDNYNDMIEKHGEDKIKDYLSRILDVLKILSEPENVLFNKDSGRIIVIAKGSEKDIEKAETIFKRVVKNSVFKFADRFDIDVSFGSSSYPADGMKAQGLLEKADSALLSEKERIAAKKILVVDDDPAVVSIEKKVLKKIGFSDIAEALSGEEALEKIDNIMPDLILLDMDMPGINGYEVLGRLKENIATRDVPVIIVSAYKVDENRVKEEIKQDIIIPVITKPITVQVLKKWLKCML